MTQSMSVAKASGPIELPWDPESLPPFPAIALKALTLMSGTNSSLIDLCNLIRSDAAFSVAILRIANSPLIAFPKNVTSVLQASMLLGFQRMRSLVLAFGLKAYIKNSFTPLMRSCWRHSVACAIIAERSAGWRFLDKDFAYTAGIFHDIGKVALATAMPEAYTHVIELGEQCDVRSDAKSGPSSKDLFQREQELCGMDHCEAGHSLMTAWRFPQNLIDMAACHHEGASRPGTAGLIPPSCELSELLGFAVSSGQSLRSYDQVLADFPDPARNRFPDEVTELASEIANEIRVIESV